MYYGLYSHIRCCAWQCLIDFHINSLPVNVSAIARQAGVHIVKNSLVNKLHPREHARSYFDGETWIIVYNDNDDPVISRFTIAHELGHFFLGHAAACAKYRHLKTDGKGSQSEMQADMFALRLLCPACVLKDMSISSPEELANICRIPIPEANKRFERISELKSRGRFLTDEKELEVYNNFSEYLKNNV